MYAISTADRKWAPGKQAGVGQRDPQGRGRRGPHPARAHDQGRRRKDAWPSGPRGTLHGERPHVGWASSCCRRATITARLGERHDVEALELRALFYAMTEKVIPGR